MVACSLGVGAVQHARKLGDYLTRDGKGVIFYKSEGDRDIRSCGVVKSLGGEGVNCLFDRSQMRSGLS